MSIPKWLEFAQKLQSIAQAGIEYSKDEYDIERFEEIQKISVDILANYTEMSHDKIRDLFANETGYQTPKIDARAVIFQDNKILLIKENIDGKWALPGGWADVDLSLKENVIKESLEEAGATVAPQRIIAIFDRKKHNRPPSPYGIYKIFVICKLLEFKFLPNIETSEAKFFTLETLPELSTGRNTIEQIKFCFDANENENSQVYFD